MDKGTTYEQLMIGALLMGGRNAVKHVIQILKPIHFGAHNTREIFRAIASLYMDSTEEIDIVSVPRKMREEGTLKFSSESDIVGFTIADTHNIPETAMAIRELAVTIAEDAVRILTSELARSMTLQVMDRTTDIFEVISTAKVKLDELGSTGRKSPVVPSTTGLFEVLDHVDALVKGTEQAWGVPTGFRTLDRYVYGFEPKNLYVIAGRPSHGKTAFMMDIARYQAHTQPVCIFSMEMALTELITRMLSGESGIPYQSIKTGKFYGNDLAILMEKAGTLGNAVGNRLYVADSAGLTLSEIRLYTMMAKEAYGIRGIYIDYLQLINMDDKDSNRDQAIGRTTRGLKALAKELNIFVVLLSQLSRAVEIRADKRPQLSDLRESGNIEQDADTVLFVWRPWIQNVHEFDHYGEHITDTKDKAVIIIGKQRNGETGEAVFNFDGSRVRFSERVYVPTLFSAPAPAHKELPPEETLF
jgi:replicative DNA helicase